jgi:hypothetical protein
MVEIRAWLFSKNIEMEVKKSVNMMVLVVV